jgi:predicted butyrate kinase (DUF1464 family)
MSRRLRVAGCDPGTSSLDVLVLEDGNVGLQVRFPAEQLRAEPALPVAWLRDHGPFDLIAGPSGYGLPLIAARDCTPRDLELMSLVRPEERGSNQGVAGFSALLRELIASGLPIIFLPGVIHLDAVPAHRKLNALDLGTPDKVSVATLSLALEPQRGSACVVELGSAFTGCVVLADGRIVAGVGGTSGPLGATSGGAWDGEAAYLLGPLTKDDLFHGGLADLPPDVGPLAFRESLLLTVAGLAAVHRFARIVLSGRLLETHQDLVAQVEADLSALAPVERLGTLPGAWVKHAAQGAAVIADGLSGGKYAATVDRLGLRACRGTVLDHLAAVRVQEMLRGSWS